MQKYKKLVSLIFAVILCFMAGISIADTEETRYETNLDQDAMRTYIENLTANGGSVDIAYRKVLRDYDRLIPESYASDSQRLHFNLWLTNSYG